MSGEETIAVAATASIWQEHCRSAVRKFVMNAVVIDNQPIVVPSGTAYQSGQTATATASDDGMGPEVAESREEGDFSQVAQIVASPPGAEDAHALDIRAISDAFSEQEIACAFVLPDDQDPNREKIFDRIIRAACHADIVVIDWYLKDTDPTLTKSVLTEIARKDSSEKGRLRLFCVYTGQTDLSDVTSEAISALKMGGLSFSKESPEEGLAIGEAHYLIVVGKKEVKSAALPAKLLDAFTNLADGILPAFAIAAVAAVRRNVHHIITCFSKELDAAYVANRLITDPPSDVAQLMRELFASECDTAVGLEKVADKYLGTTAITAWLNAKQKPSAAFKISEKNIDRNFINALLANGLAGDHVKLADGTAFKIKEKQRQLISHALHGGKEQSLEGERKFSRRVVLKRECYGNTKITSPEGWTPSLTLGTILRQERQEGEEKVVNYFYCITPACDTVRLNGKTRTFLMFQLDEKTDKANLVLLEKGSQCKKLYGEPRPLNIRTFHFQGCPETGRVLATKVNSDTAGGIDFVFKSVDQPAIELQWLGEVRRNRAHREIAELNREWLRFGILESEFLRLAGKGLAET